MKKGNTRSNWQCLICDSQEYHPYTISMATGIIGGGQYGHR